MSFVLPLATKRVLDQPGYSVRPCLKIEKLKIKKKVQGPAEICGYVRKKKATLAVPVT